MQIHILQNAISFGDIYNIAINDKVRYRAEGHLSNPFSSLSLYLKNNELALSIFRSWNSIFPNYSIYFNNDSISTRIKPLKFKTSSYFRNAYSCEWDGDYYEILAHKGLKFSVFRNGIQVAGINQERWSSFKEDGFRLECNNDCHKEFMIALTLILDKIHNRQISLLSGLITYNIGITNEMKPFDENWKSQ